MRYVAAAAALALLISTPASAISPPGVTHSPNLTLVQAKKKKTKQVRRVDREKKAGMSSSERFQRCMARRSSWACSRIK